MIEYSISNFIVRIWKGLKFPVIYPAAPSTSCVFYIYISSENISYSLRENDWDWRKRNLRYSRSIKDFRVDRNKKRRYDFSVIISVKLGGETLRPNMSDCYSSHNFIGGYNIELMKHKYRKTSIKFFLCVYLLCWKLVSNAPVIISKYFPLEDR